MTTLNPSPQQIKAAMAAKGVPARFYKGWDTIGREWQGPDQSPGLMGVLVHHTSTASAVGDGPDWPSLEWCVTAFNRPAANWLIGRDGTSWLLSAGSAFHSGLGGPWPEIGLNSAGNRGHYRLVGIEIDDPGTGETITPAQIESVGRILAAYKDLCGWDYDRITTHYGWTDMGPYMGRKNDTLKQYYPISFWRQQAQKYASSAVVPPVVSDEEDMPIILKKGNSVHRLLDGGKMVNLSQASVDAFVKAGVKVVPVAMGDWPSLENTFS